MQLIHNIISAIATPTRQIYYWLLQIVPGLRAIAGSSLPMRMSLMTLIFLLIIWLAAFIKIYVTRSDNQAEMNWVTWIIGGVLGVVVIPTIVFYLTKFLMIRDESRYPEIDAIWYEAMEECERLGIDLLKVPLFLNIGAPQIRFGGQLLKQAEMDMSVVVPRQGNGDIAVYGNSDAVFVVLSGCSCLSRLAALPTERISFGQAPAANIPIANDGGMTIAPDFFANQTRRIDEPASLERSGSGGAGADGGMGGAAPGGTILLPDDHVGFDDILGGEEETTIVKAKHLSSTDEADSQDRLHHVCGLIKDKRTTHCPINGILTTIPFDTIESSSAQLQRAAQIDLAILRQELMVRCGNTVLVTNMEQEEGFQDLINRFGAQRSRDFRFGKGCELWAPPEASRLAAVAAHATGAFEDWIYMLFQDETARKRRINSRLFKLLCKMRGTFSKSISDLLAGGFGFDPVKNPELANEQFLFGGCYFAGTGDQPDKQAFVRSVVSKLIEQDGQLEWAPLARRIDNQYQFAANLAVLVGVASLIAIAVMLVIHFQ